MCRTHRIQSLGLWQGNLCRSKPSLYVQNSPDAVIRKVLTVYIAAEPFPVKPSHGRSQGQAIVQSLNADQRCDTDWSQQQHCPVRIWIRESRTINDRRLKKTQYIPQTSDWNAPFCSIVSVIISTWERSASTRFKCHKPIPLYSCSGAYFINASVENKLN